MLVDSIVWDVSRDIVSIGPITLRWYGILFAMAFIVGYKIMEYVYKHEGLPKEEVDRVSLFMFVGVVLGARLGHVFFYQPDYYLQNPIEILYIWEGGLASHGAAIGILIALFIYSRKPVIPSYMWILDRIILTIPIGGFFVRMGNLMNSEIYGDETSLPWGFIFVRDPDAGPIPRHPTQIYEALGYLITFILLFLIYRSKKQALQPGRLFGLFLILLFTVRFLVEFVKEEQVAFEEGMTLNMGQWLSIPFIAIGLFILIRSYRLTPEEKI